MKALTLARFSKSPLAAMALTDRPVPEPRHGEVLVQMRAVGLNPADLHIAQGQMKIMSPIKPPFVLGVDGAGVVASDGARFRRGQRVMLYTGLVHSGTLAEVAAFPEAWLAPVPEGWSDAEAGAAPLALLVAQKVLDRAGAKAGESLLVNGAGGPVGAATVALAVARGLQVHGSGAAADEANVRSLGATGYSDYRQTPVRSLGPCFDIALDSLGGAVFTDSLAALKPGGRIVSLKVMTGTQDLEAMGMRLNPLIRLLLPLAFRKAQKAASRAQVKLIGLASHQDGATLAQAVAAAQAAGYRPRIDSTHALTDYRLAFTRLAANPRGKVVASIPWGGARPAMPFPV